jgi:hypothetical protein
MVRWKLIDASGQTHRGPLYHRDSSPEEVQRAVSRWWEGKKRQAELQISNGDARAFLAQGCVCALEY